MLFQIFPREKYFVRLSYARSIWVLRLHCLCAPDYAVPLANVVKVTIRICWWNFCHSISTSYGVPGKCPLLGEHPCTKFQGVYVAASIQMYTRCTQDLPGTLWYYNIVKHTNWNSYVSLHVEPHLCERKGGHMNKAKCLMHVHNLLYILGYTWFIWDGWVTAMSKSYNH